MTETISNNNVVTLEYDPTWTALEWAREHCPSYITNDLHISDNIGPMKINYYFSSSKDAMWFTMRWV